MKKTISMLFSGMVALLLIVVLAGQTVQAEQTHTVAFSPNAPTAVTGVVFQDDNANGARDAGEPGLAGVTITAYDASGAVADTATSAADGSYTLPNLIDGTTYRIEFTDPPSNMQSGPQGSGSQTTVTFITAPATDVDAGFHNSAEYCQDLPDMATSVFVQGGSSGSQPGLVSYPYTAHSPMTGWDVPPPTSLVLYSQTGSAWGLAYQRPSHSIFMSAYMKRHTPFGPGGTGAIYRYDRDTGALTQFLDIDALFPGSTGVDPHPAGADFVRDAASWDPVGKIAFGDIDLSEDETTLWAISLNDRQLYEIPLGSASSPTPPTSASQVHRWPEDTTTGANLSDLPGLADCPNPDVDIRPFGLKVHDGNVYIGMVCSAESTQDRNDLRAYAYRFDPASHTFTQVLNFPLNYGRGWALKYSNGDQRGANWQYWRTDGNLTPTSGQRDVVWPQPMFSDIEFDNGDMIIGLRDRLGDQTGKDQSPPAGGGLVSGVTAGDILRASPDVSGGWIIEYNAQGFTFGPSSGVNNGQGPGGGEFYYQDHFIEWSTRHDETSQGALAQVPGKNEVLVSVMDPLSGEYGAWFQSGILWMNNSTGHVTQRYKVTENFGKAHGLGDIEALCDAPPIEIGNRIWLDLDADGVQDANETPLAGVTVTLHAPDGTQIGSAVTDANGEFYFSSDPNRTDTANSDYGIADLIPTTDGFTIHVDLGQANLAGLALTTPDADTSANGDARDSDAVQVGNDAVIVVNTGPSGENNHTYDIGFQLPTDWGDLPETGNGSFPTTIANDGPRHVITSTLYLGSCVDAENDGQPDNHAGVDGNGSGNGDDGNGGNPPAAGACANEGDDEDGVTLITPMIPGSQACFSVTAHNGTDHDVNIYAWIDWNGDGDFGDGNTVDADEAFTLGVVTANTDWNDHEICTSVPAAATFDGGETHMRFRFTSDSLAGPDWGGLASDGEVEDYWQPFACVGNYVWDDTSGTTANEQDANDTPLENVTVRLVWADGNGTVDTDASDGSAQGDDIIYTTTTDANGRYSFCGLIPDTYRVEIPTTPTGLQAVTANSGDNAHDSDGLPVGGGSAVNGSDFTITDVSTLPTDEDGNGDSGSSGGDNNFPDNQVDETFDFGFQRLSDWGDLPESGNGSFPTTSGNNGPSHFITPALYLGSCVDSENDGQPGPMAGVAGTTGDDSAVGSSTIGTCAQAGNDEDGLLSSISPAAPGEAACFNVMVTNNTGSNARLYAWVDFDGDGVFTPDEQLNGVNFGAAGYATISSGLSGVVQNLCFTMPDVPDDGPEGAELHARLRLTTEDLSQRSGNYELWAGPAADGEVEDYWSPLACVGNYVWLDDGTAANTQDGGDSPLEDVSLRLVWAGLNGAIETGPDDATANNDDVILSTATTDANGRYKFCGLPAGAATAYSYQVQIPSMPGYESVTANSGSDVQLDSDADPGDTVDGGWTGAIFGLQVNYTAPGYIMEDGAAMPTGEAGTEDANSEGADNNTPDERTDWTHDFGFRQTKVAIGNFVWHDSDGNSAFNGSEEGIDGVMLKLYRDSDGDGVCEPDSDTEVATTTTSGGGFYQFLNVDPSTSSDATTYYCVAVVKSTVPHEYDYSSVGGAQNPDATGDHDAANGDDGIPVGGYVISQPFPATVHGQTNTGDTGDPMGYDDNSAYMTVDFGFLTQDDYNIMILPNAIRLSGMNARSDAGLWVLGLLALVLAGLTTFIWQRRQAF